MLGIIHKIFLWLRSFVACLTWREKRGLASATREGHGSYDAGNPRSPSVHKKTVIFVRHGESDWNEIFNRGKILLLPRLIHGLVREIFRCHRAADSVFLDSPLSARGARQAEAMRQYVFDSDLDIFSPQVRHHIVQLRGTSHENGACVMVSSNLRRAVHTGCLGMWPRMRRTGERICILSSLQEMSRNVDTASITEPGEIPETTLVSQKIGGQGFVPRASINASANEGDKPMCSSALPRLIGFCDWCFNQKAKVVIVAAGHSLWFKNFFRTFLPSTCSHEAKKCKLYNCGVVAFTLVSHDDRYSVLEESIEEVYLGFKRPRPGSFKTKAGAATVTVVFLAWAAQRAMQGHPFHARAALGATLLVLVYMVHFVVGACAVGAGAASIAYLLACRLPESARLAIFFVATSAVFVACSLFLR